MTDRDTIKLTPKITLIVAVYNAESYLDTFMRSLLSQTFNDFEVVLVDDGSSDSSAQMCDDYAERNANIRVIHQPNGGVASARQTGIDNARGEYTIHADPDDTIAPTFLEELYAEAVAQDADVVMCDYNKVREHATEHIKIEPTSLCPTDLLDDMLLNKVPGFLCNKLIRRSLYDKYNITLVKGLNYCEDLLVCVKLMLHDIRVAHVRRGLYNYNLYINPNSISRNYSRDKLEMRLQLLRHLYSAIPEGTHRKGLNDLTTSVAYQCLKYGILSDEEFKSIFSQYTKMFAASSFNIKRRFVLILSAWGCQSIARCFIKKRRAYARDRRA